MRIKNVQIENLRRLIEVNTITPLVMTQVLKFLGCGSSTNFA